VAEEAMGGFSGDFIVMFVEFAFSEDASFDVDAVGFGSVECLFASIRLRWCDFISGKLLQISTIIALVGCVHLHLQLR
jgi:hypothetical protein